MNAIFNIQQNHNNLIIKIKHLLNSGDGNSIVKFFLISIFLKWIFRDYLIMINGQENHLVEHLLDFICNS